MVRAARGNPHWTPGTRHTCMRPAATHVHAQAHHARREVFLSSVADDVPAESLLRPVTIVRSMAELERTQGDDVFVCEYAYDTEWRVRWGALCCIMHVCPQRFQRRAEGGDEDADWVQEDHSDDDDCPGAAEVCLTTTRFVIHLRHSFCHSTSATSGKACRCIAEGQRRPPRRFRWPSRGGHGAGRAAGRARDSGRPRWTFRQRRARHPPRRAGHVARRHREALAVAWQRCSSCSRLARPAACPAVRQSRRRWLHS